MEDLLKKCPMNCASLRYWLIILGAVVFALMGLFNFDLIKLIFGAGFITRIIYILIGFAGLYEFFIAGKSCPSGSCETAISDASQKNDANDDTSNCGNCEKSECGDCGECKKCESDQTCTETDDCGDCDGCEKCEPSQTCEEAGDCENCESPECKGCEECGNANGDTCAKCGNSDCNGSCDSE